MHVCVSARPKEGAMNKRANGEQTKHSGKQESECVHAFLTSWRSHCSPCRRATTTLKGFNSNRDNRCNNAVETAPRPRILFPFGVCLVFTHLLQTFETRAHTVGVTAARCTTAFVVSGSGQCSCDP